MKDFFISYNKDDKQWAEWIGWTLEEADYEVYIQAWDFRPGSHFINEMHKATTGAEKTIVVLSPSYLGAEYTHPEWQAAFALDPRGELRKLVPFRVRECSTDGLLKQVVYVDLVGLSEADAKLALLGAFSDRAKPARKPSFPGLYNIDKTIRSISKQVAFPGIATQREVAGAIVTGRAGTTDEDRAEVRTYTPADVLSLIQSVNQLTSQQFNMLIFAASPPQGKVPTMPAPQVERVQALFDWAVGDGGLGLQEIEGLLNTLERSADHPVSTPSNTQRRRPAMGGDSISQDRGGAATLGCLVRDRKDSGKIYILSDFNALCDLHEESYEGAAILQPGRADGGNRAADLIATLSRWAKVKDDPSAAAENISAALAQVIRPEDVSAEIRGRSYLKGTMLASIGMPVSFVGRTSGEVKGEVLQVGAAQKVPVSYYQVEGGVRSTGGATGFHPILFGDLIVCSNPIAPGDCGAVLMDADNRALGLSFAGSKEVSLFIPIDRILDALEVDLVLGS